jgi:hypothetical protein
VKRVLEEIAEVHRDRHHRDRHKQGYVVPGEYGLGFRVEGLGLRIED